MKSTTRFYKNKKGLECLNCGQPLNGTENFCPECGQVNDELPLSVKQFISEFFAGFFSFDTQFFKTIVPLLFKPGKVSKEYIEGKRRKYTNPFKMYLHTSIVFFLLMGLINTVNDFKQLDKIEVNNDAAKDSVLNQLEESGIDIGEIYFIKKYNKKLDSVLKQNDYKALFNNDTITQSLKDSLYQQLLEMGMNMKMIDVEIKDTNIGNIDVNEIVASSTQKGVVKKQLEFYLKKNKIQYNPEKTSLSKNNNYDISKDLIKNSFGDFFRFSKVNKDLSPSEALDSLGYEKTKMNVFKYQRARDLNKLLKDKDFQKSYVSSILSKLSIAIFFLLPIFTLFFSLFYIRHRYNYTEHLVVVFNLQTVFFIMLVLILISQLISDSLSEFITPILQLLLLFYIYKTLRNFYQQSRIKTIVKLVILNFTYMFLAFIGLSIVSFLAFLM